MIGIIWLKISIKLAVPSKDYSKQKVYYGCVRVNETLALFATLTKKQAENFCHYLETHRHRIINYNYYQQEGICSIASGAVESTVKQIDRRLQISGAQWHEENVPQVLKHRCAYLNNTLARA